MTLQTWLSNKDSIITDVNRVIVKTNFILSDEFGEQEILAKIETISSNGVHVAEFSYTGNTTNWSVQGVDEKLIINGVEELMPSNV